MLYLVSEFPSPAEVLGGKEEVWMDWAPGFALPFTVVYKEIIPGTV